MPRPQAPTEELPCDEINSGELLAAIKHTKSTTSPSPFDQIPYTVFKQCRSLGKALLNLFSCCWSQAVIPPEWKLAAIKLVGLSCRRSHDPSQFPPYCAYFLCRQAIHHHIKEPMAQLHDMQWLSQQLQPTPTEGRPADQKDFQACSAVVVRDALAEDPSCSRKALAAAAKRKVKSQEDADTLLQVQDLQKQGEMLRTTTSSTATLWSKAVQALPSNIMKFALNAAHDTLPHDANV